MAGIMMETAAYAIVSARPWVVPDRVGEVFTIPSWCMRETDMRTEEGKWTAKKDREINFDNLITCLRQMFHRIIDPTYHTGELLWEEEDSDCDLPSRYLDYFKQGTERRLPKKNKMRQSASRLP